MALLFSAVTLTANDQDAEFLVSGIPRDTDDLEGWTAYEGFIGELDEECEVSVHVEAYLYGEGETFRASLEEIAYFTNRLNVNPGFLSDSCDNIEDADFTFQWSPEELFGLEMN